MMVVALRLEPSVPPLPVVVPLPSPPPLCCPLSLEVVFDTAGGIYVPPGAFVQTYCPVVFVQRPRKFWFQDKSWVTVTLLVEVERLCAN